MKTRLGMHGIAEAEETSKSSWSGPVKGPIGVCAAAMEEQLSARRRGNVSFMTGELRMHLEVNADSPHSHALAGEARGRAGADGTSLSAENASCDAVAIDAIANVA